MSCTISQVGPCGRVFTQGQITFRNNDLVACMDRFSVIINIIKRMLVIRILLGVPIAACGGRGDSKSHLIGSWRGGLYLPPEDHLGF